MIQTQLPYGETSLGFDSDGQFVGLAGESEFERHLSDAEVGMALDNPIDSPPLDEIASSSDSVLLVVSDATRATGSAQIVNLVVRRLIQSGVSAGNIAIIFATGIHRPVSDEEKVKLLTPFIVQRLRTLVHDAYNPGELVSLGSTASGVTVEVNRALKEFSQVILIGGVGFHYFAGFSGGRKSICPGLASAQTIKATHMLALDFETGGRKRGVGTGLLEGNAVHEECERVAQLVDPVFSINTIVSEKKQAVNVFCGHWRSAHRTACDRYLADHSVAISGKRELVIVSCGGFPHDINLIQAHKALDMAAHACADGGTIILLAECRDGLGRPDFLKWFDSVDSRALETRLGSEYEVNGQTAWSLLSKAENYQIILVSNLPDESVRQMRMTPASTLAEALLQARAKAEGFIMPRGAAILPRVTVNS